MRFITLDGADNIGKTTLIQRLVKRDNAISIAFPSKKFRESDLWKRASTVTKEEMEYFVFDWLIAMKNDMKELCDETIKLNPTKKICYVDRSFISAMVYQFNQLFEKEIEIDMVKYDNEMFLDSKNKPNIDEFFDTWIKSIYSLMNESFPPSTLHILLNLPKLNITDSVKPSEVDKTNETFDSMNGVRYIYYLLTHSEFILNQYNISIINIHNQTVLNDLTLTKEEALLHSLDIMRFI